MQPSAEWLALWALPGIILASALGAFLMCLLVLRYGFPPFHEEVTDDTRAAAARGVVFTRFGHAAAGVCFAVTAILGVVALAEQSRVAVPRGVSGAPLESPTAKIRAEIGELRSELNALRARVGEAQSKLGTADGRLDSVESRLKTTVTRTDAIDGRVRATEISVRQASGDASRALEGLRQLERGAASAPPAIPGSRQPNVARDASRAAAAVPPLVRVERPPLVPPTETMAAETATVNMSRHPAPGLGGKLRDDWNAIKREAKNGGDEIKNALRKLRAVMTP